MQAKGVEEENEEEEEAFQGDWDSLPRSLACYPLVRFYERVGREEKGVERTNGGVGSSKEGGRKAALFYLRGGEFG